MKHLLISIILTLSFSTIFSQSKEDSTLYLVVKSDNKEFYGYILKDNGREILLETKSIGKIYIDKNDILKIEKVAEQKVEEPTEQVYKDYRLEGPFTTRYYFTTNALPIKKNENYAMIHLYGPEVHFAVTDNFSIGVMATWIASPIAVAAKYSFNSKGKTHLAIGTIMGSSGYLFGSAGYGGLHWLTLTHGGRKSNISLSAGYSYIGGLLRMNGITPAGRDAQSIGKEYYFQSTNKYGAYYIDSYKAERALQHQVGDKLIKNPAKRDFKGAIAFGVSGILPIGKKISFIFDSMTFISEDESNKYSLKYENHKETVSYDDYDNSAGGYITQTREFTIGKARIVASNIKEYKATIIMMPGMRFTSSYNTSFQVALAGVINIKTKGRSNSFPAPMISWLKKF